MPRTPGSRNWDNDEIFKLLDAFQHLAQQDQGFRTMMRETQAGELHTELAKRGVLASVDQVESKMKRLRKNLMDWNLPGARIKDITLYQKLRETLGDELQPVPQHFPGLPEPEPIPPQVDVPLIDIPEEESECTNQVCLDRLAALKSLEMEIKSLRKKPCHSVSTQVGEPATLHENIKKEAKPIKTENDSTDTDMAGPSSAPQAQRQLKYQK